MLFFVCFGDSISKALSITPRKANLITYTANFKWLFF